MDTTKIYQAISAVSEKVNDISYRLDQLIQIVNLQKQSDIDYIAMETGVDLDQENENN